MFCADQRYYASSYGRFNSVDPMASSANPKDPSSWNRYSYTIGDPVNHSDPSGMNEFFDGGLDDGGGGDGGGWGSPDPCQELDSDFWGGSFNCGFGIYYDQPASGSGAGGGGGGGSPNPKCNPNNPTNAKILNYIAANAAAAGQVATATGLSSDFILAWGGYESNYGTSNASSVNNNFFGLTNGKWTGTSSCPANASPAFVCFGDPGLADSAQSALTSFNSKYLNAGLGAQAANGTIGAIAQAIANAGFNSEYAPGVYGNNVQDVANAIASRENCP